MNLYHLTQNTVRGWDTFSDCVVCAESPEEARKIHPSQHMDYHVGANGEWMMTDREGVEYEAYDHDWPPASVIDVELIGTASPNQKKGVICASFHAG